MEERVLSLLVYSGEHPALVLRLLAARFKIDWYGKVLTLSNDLDLGQILAICLSLRNVFKRHSRKPFIC